MGNALWTGVLTAPLKDAAFVVPARLFAGPREDHIEFRQLVDGQPLKRPGMPTAAITKGHEFAKGRYLSVAPSEIEMEPRATLPLTFVECGSVSPLLLEAPYFVHPSADDPNAEIPYAALLAALREKNAAGLTRVVLHKRERYLLIRPGSTGLIAHTLFYANEQKTLAEFRTNTGAATAEFSAAARSAVVTEPLDPAALVDEQTQSIKALLASKAKAILDAEAKAQSTPASPKGPRRIK